MKVAVFTSNQPRHLHLIERLAEVSEEVFAVMEGTSVFPGQSGDFWRKSEVMKEYFGHVMNAEARVFGRSRFLNAPNVRTLSLHMGDLNKLGMDSLEPIRGCDAFVVFGASYIKGPLIDFLVSRRAYNIHMGTSPYYRGSSCNFWALADGRPDYVGATVHLLSKGLDSGPMLFHALPAAEAADAFLLGMKAVEAAHRGLVERLASSELARMEPVPQDKAQELRYSKMAEFTDEVAARYLARQPSPADVLAALEKRDLGKFLRPFLPNA